MGLFSSKKQAPASNDDVTADDVLVDAKYREELRALGREKFKETIAKQSDYLQKQIDEMMEQVAADAKLHVTRKVDALMGRLNAEVTNQLNERLREYSRVSGEAQELVAQSLSRNAQMVHEKFQQLSLDLQRTVANQEVMMATVFQDSKTQVSAIQSEQSKILDQLRASEEATRRETEELTRALRQTIDDQSVRLGEVYKENIEGVETTRDKQAAMLETLARTTGALEEQYKQLQELLDKSIADQKAMVVETINDNMARIVEHYLIGALGEQSNIREQMPAILQRMEESKQAMADDMRL
jgi:hypothetical protein